MVTVEIATANLAAALNPTAILATPRTLVTATAIANTAVIATPKAATAALNPVPSKSC